MPKATQSKPSIFYRYRAFSTTTLNLLCQDQLYFAQPTTFNDPMDCQPCVECDSPMPELRKLLTSLIQKRVEADVQSHLNSARVKSQSMASYAARRAEVVARRRLEDIAYYATNPDHEVGVEKAERASLVANIQRELHRHYDRGVCCFSTTDRSSLLWSHYGDQHQGLCVGYTTERTPVPQPRAVTYSNSRAVRTSLLVNALVLEREDAITELDQRVLMQKAKAWKYEKEWRLIGRKGLQDSPLLMKEITFGLRCPSPVAYAIFRALQHRTHPLRFYRIRERRGSYALLRQQIHECDFAEDLPVTATSADETFPFELTIDSTL